MYRMSRELCVLSELRDRLRAGGFGRDASAINAHYGDDPWVYRRLQ
jgi:hypothetical protein